MKATILSDLHIDRWCGDGNVISSKELFRVFHLVLDPSPDVEVLIVAGDISHANEHYMVLEDLAMMFRYKVVFAVLGNHDIYLTDPIKRSRYLNDSKLRQKDWYSRRAPHVHLLDGETYSYKGITFGGCMSWYDASYNRPAGWSDAMMVNAWRQGMSDPYYLSGYKDLFEIFKQERPKIESILKSDVIITHVSPLASAMGYAPHYRSDKFSAFYSFDGEKYLDQTNAQYWVYGHTHGTYEYEVYGVHCIMNALGYPGEEPEAKLVNIDIKT